MTWQSFFDFSTMGHRHIVFVYAGVWIAQIGYLAWIAWSWTNTKSARR